MTTSETTETKRDLHADLAIINAATAGPWRITEDDERPVMSEHCAVLLARGGWPSYIGISSEDQEFIAEARTGRPHALERVINAEAKWEQLRAIVLTNATGNKGTDINDWDVMLNVMDDIMTGGDGE